ncbi:NLR family CARD domain-containing protein 3-like isoform X2 [Xiphophorus hellerii]|uniref:NLR family CARD domain-containing protein 3-like isoform X2 n=1 Tax=Xiphophorus hellerii TaxID=8084 RepID=UPI0013B42B10|nr:NLR family CARD domain-containing protein 3-like isoform X2 [Xiphophorus hellerii]
MDQCEDREEGVPPSKTTLCGEDESQSKGQRIEKVTLKNENESKDLSFKSHDSKDMWWDFKSDQPPPPERMEKVTLKNEYELRDLSFKSHDSRDMWWDFKSDQPPPPERMEKVTLKNEHEFRDLSFKSHDSRDMWWDFKSDQPPPPERMSQKISEIPSGPSGPQYQTQLDSIFMLLKENIVTFVTNELKKIQKVLSPEDPEWSECERDDEELEGENEEQRKSSREAVMKITINFLRRMKQEELVERLQRKHLTAIGQHKLKSSLKKKFQCVFEGIAKAGSPTLLNQIYTELYITEGGTGGVNDEHEVRQIETASRKPHRPETTIRQEDIFKVQPGRDQSIRTVMTKGVAGIGKTVLTQKFTLDWAEDKAHQNIQFIFPFTFRELNVLKEKKFSLVELIHHFFTETKEICSFEHFQVLFIFDGLDESRLPLDFHNKEILTDATESTSVDVLLTNLIRGKLLPSALLWITTRPAAARQIPPQCVGMVTEVRGFTDPQKEEYFRKRFRDEQQASRIISHMKTSRSLHIMCHIPVFCWITATVLKDVLEIREGGELPSTLTEMYIHFLVVQTKVKKVKYDEGAEKDPHWSPESRKMIESLGKLAFDQLQKGNLIFYESDLTECGIDIRAASVYSGVFTQIFREERGLYQDKVFCFVHLSVQEFLAALHVHLTFINSGVNLMEEKQSAIPTLFHKSKIISLHQNAVDRALHSSNGHLDLLLRFLLGLSLQTSQRLLKGLFTQTGSGSQSNQRLLQGLLVQTGSSSQTNQKIVQYIKEKINENVSAEKSINLFHCLNELNDRSLVEEIQQSLSSGSLSTDKLSPAQWSALGFILLSSGEDLDVFDLKKYSASEEVFLRLLPVVKASNKALLSNCNLSERSCEALSSVLRSQSSSLKELDLKNNSLKDSGVKLLSDGLKSPYCKLEKLTLSGCLITEDGCASLVSALKSNPHHLQELDLSYNHPGDSGVNMLSAGLRDPHWRLEMLRVEPAGNRYLKPGPWRYSCQLTFDRDTINQNFQLSNNDRKVTDMQKAHSDTDYLDRRNIPQLLCRNVISDRCYWEVEWRGKIEISVTYRGIRRRGLTNDSVCAKSDDSWSLSCSDDGYTVSHYKNRKLLSSSSFSTVSNRVAVYVDCPAGSLSFYRVSSDSLIHLHTFNTTFTDTLYPGFTVLPGSSVFLC